MTLMSLLLSLLPICVLGFSPEGQQACFVGKIVSAALSTFRASDSRVKTDVRRREECHELWLLKPSDLLKSRLALFIGN